jgi:hypothetical protein
MEPEGSLPCSQEPERKGNKKLIMSINKIIVFRFIKRVTTFVNGTNRTRKIRSHLFQHKNDKFLYSSFIVSILIIFCIPFIVIN